MLGCVGVERNVGTVEDDQQLTLAGFQPGEGLVEVGEAGGAAEDAIEPGLEAGLGLGRRAGPIELQVPVEPPDQVPDQNDGGTLLVGHGDQGVDQALGMDPAQTVAEDIELPRTIADDDGVSEQAMMIEAADDGGLRGQPDGLDADLDQEVGPGVLGGPGPALVRHQPVDQEFRSLLLVEPDQGGGVDHVVLITGPNRLRKMGSSRGFPFGRFRKIHFYEHISRDFAGSEGFLPL